MEPSCYQLLGAHTDLGMMVRSQTLPLTNLQGKNGP